MRRSLRRSGWRCAPTRRWSRGSRSVATAILAEVGGEAVASANAKEKGKTIKGVIADCLTGENGRPKREAWVPRWMAFPPSAYTARGGVATVTAAERAQWIAEQEQPDEPDPTEPSSHAASPEEGEESDPSQGQSDDAEAEQLAA